MRVLIAGIDGYLGWALSQHLASLGHTVGGIDRFLRREWVTEVGGISALPIASWEERHAAFTARFGYEMPFAAIDMLDFTALSAFITDFKPDAVVHFAEMPSAPYSMIDAAHSAFTQQNNVIGSLNLLWVIHNVCPDAHLIKLGTMGEYGTPDIDIPEGFFEVEYRGRRDTLPFPRQAGSFYHWSKVHDSNNTMFACKTWGLKATDVMQGVVYGLHIDAMKIGDRRMATRLDFDTCFGTAINRFVCQAIIGHPLTVYGEGKQKRGFLPLQDSMACITLMIENPPAIGEYRVFNQFEETYSIIELAEIVRDEANLLGMNARIQHYENPRTERSEHYYNPDRHRLVELGYRPRGQIRPEIARMLTELAPHRSRIEAYADILIPQIRWDSEHRPSQTI